MPGWYLDNGSLYVYDDPTAGYHATMTPLNQGQVVLKQLYLYSPSTNDMETSPSSSDWSDSIGGLLGGSDSWTQSKPFSKNFVLRNNVSLYVPISNGLGLLTSTTITLSYYSPGVGTRTLVSVTNPSLLYLGGYSYMQATANLGSDVTINKGGYFMVTVAVGGVLGSVTVFQDTSHGVYPRIEAWTPTYINVDNEGIYDTNNNAIDSLCLPSNINVTANVSDPFGAYDIKGVNLTVYDPTGAVLLGPVDMSKKSSGPEWGYYNNIAQINAGIRDGVYNVVVWATETNGVKSGMSKTLDITNPLNVTVNKSIVRTSGNNYNVIIKVYNNQSWQNAYIYVYDFYPTGANGFTASGFSSNPSATISTPLYSVSGTVNKWGPLNLAGYSVTTITYNVLGTGDYRLSDLYVVGVDPP